MQESTNQQPKFPQEYDPTGSKFIELYKKTLMAVKFWCSPPVDREEVAMELTCRAFSGAYTDGGTPPERIAPIIIKNYCTDILRHLRLERAKLQVIHETDRIKDIHDEELFSISPVEVLGKVNLSSFEISYIYYRFYNNITNPKELSTLIGIKEEKLQMLQSNLFFKIRQKVQELNINNENEMRAE